MKDEEAIKYLDSLEPGQFCTINIPLFSGEFIASTCMYLGKDDEGRYVLKDDNCFKMSKNFLMRNRVSIDRNFDGDKALDIYAEIRRETNIKKQKNNNRDAR